MRTMGPYIFSPMYMRAMVRHSMLIGAAVHLAHWVTWCVELIAAGAKVLGCYIQACSTSHSWDKKQGLRAMGMQHI